VLKQFENLVLKGQPLKPPGTGIIPFPSRTKYFYITEIQSKFLPQALYSDIVLLVKG